MLCSSLLDNLCLGALHTALKWFTQPHSPHIMPYAGHCLGGWLDPQYLQVPALIILALVCPAPLNCIILASSCFASLRTCLLVILSILPLVLIPPIIFTLMPSSSRPHMNCSFIHLSSSKYSHFSASAFTLLIHFSRFSSLHFFQFTKSEGFDCLIIFFFCLYYNWLLSCVFHYMNDLDL